MSICDVPHLGKSPSLPRKSVEFWLVSHVSPKLQDLTETMAHYPGLLRSLIATQTQMILVRPSENYHI